MISENSEMSVIDKIVNMLLWNNKLTSFFVVSDLQRLWVSALFAIEEVKLIGAFH